MVCGIVWCFLVALAAANPVPFAKDSIAPNRNHGVHQGIVNGINAKYGLFNYMLSLRENGSAVCGATLVSSSRAITAAHCLEEGSSYSVEAGQLNFKRPSGYEVSKPVKEFIKHPNYDPDDEWRNDIAILKFDPIPSGQYINPIPMITDPNENLTTMTCWTAGWGKTSAKDDGSDMLKFSDVIVMTNRDCKKRWGDVFPTQVCAHKYVNKVSVCEGDSGGSLTCETANGEKLAGVTSLGHVKCKGRFPSVFTRVSEYKDWIAQNL